MNETEHVNKINIDCDCGCGHLVIMSWNDDDTVCMAYYPYGAIADYKPIRRRLKAVWNILRGKEYTLYDLVFTKEILPELMRKLRVAYNTSNVENEPKVMQDIFWHSWAEERMVSPGNYIVQVIVREGDYDEIDWLYTKDVYWDGESDFVFDNSLSNVKYPIDNILEWAYDGND